MEKILKEIIAKNALGDIIKMLLKDGLLSDNVSTYLVDKGFGGLLGALVGAAGAAAGLGNIVWTTAISVTGPAAGIWGWLGYTTVTVTTTSFSLPVAVVAAVSAGIGYGIYTAYQYSQRDEATVKEYSKLCNYEWNKLFNYAHSPSNETLSQVAEYMYNYGGKIDSKSKMESINDAIRILYIATFAKNIKNKLKIEDACKLATTLVRSEREKRIQYSSNELEKFLSQIP